MTKEEEVIEIKRYICLRCNHKWLPRSNKKPVTCPRCKSPYWDKQKR